MHPDASKVGESPPEPGAFGPVGSDDGAPVPSPTTASGLPGGTVPSAWVVGRSGEAAGNPRASRSRGARFVDAVLAVAALGTMYIVSALAVVGRPELVGAERLGYRAGVVLMGVLIGLGARWLYLRRRDVARPVTRMLSPWLAVGALAVTFTSAGAYTPRPPADPTTALRVGSGYVLTEADPELVKQVEAQFAAQADIPGGRIEIRQVEGADGSLSFLMVADAALAPDSDPAEVARGMADAAGTDPRVDSIGGQPVAIISTSEQTLVGWIESPFLLVTIGADEPTARAVAAAVLAAGP